MWARMFSGNFAEMTTSTPFRNLLHASNLRHGTDGFTSPPKEGVLRIFFALKNPTASAGFELANLGTRGQHATPRPMNILDLNLLVLCFKFRKRCRREFCVVLLWIYITIPELPLVSKSLHSPSQSNSLSYNILYIAFYRGFRIILWKRFIYYWIVQRQHVTSSCRLNMDVHFIKI